MLESSVVTETSRGVTCGNGDWEAKWEKTEWPWGAGVSPDWATRLHGDEAYGLCACMYVCTAAVTEPYESMSVKF